MNSRLYHQIFKFKKFNIVQDDCAMKVNTDSVLLGAWSELANKCSVLDIGTGSGLIALMLAQRSQKVHVTGVEIDPLACDNARYNVGNSIFADRVQIFENPIQNFGHRADQLYDLIISNPPYFNTGPTAENIHKAQVRHTLALTHHDLLLVVQRLLAQEGHFDLILPYEEGMRFLNQASFHQLSLVKITEVRSRVNKKVERVLIRLGHKTLFPPNKDELIIHDGPGPKDYTEEFKNLTKEFYIFL